MLAKGHGKTAESTRVPDPCELHPRMDGRCLDVAVRCCALLPVHQYTHSLGRAH